jgi:hypothetical protein
MQQLIKPKHYEKEVVVFKNIMDYSTHRRRYARGDDGGKLSDKFQVAEGLV